MFLKLLFSHLFGKHLKLLVAIEFWITSLTKANLPWWLSLAGRRGISNLLLFQHDGKHCAPENIQSFRKGFIHMPKGLQRAPWMFWFLTDIQVSAFLKSCTTHWICNMWTPIKFWSHLKIINARRMHLSSIWSTSSKGSEYLSTVYERFQFLILI